jgi:hypothetical protein
MFNHGFIGAAVQGLVTALYNMAVGAFVLNGPLLVALRIYYSGWFQPAPGAAALSHPSEEGPAAGHRPCIPRPLVIKQGCGVVLNVFRKGNTATVCKKLP